MTEVPDCYSTVVENRSTVVVVAVVDDDDGDVVVGSSAVDSCQRIYCSQHCYFHSCNCDWAVERRNSVRSYRIDSCDSFDCSYASDQGWMDCLDR